MRRRRVPEPPPSAPRNAELRAGTLVGVFGLHGELKLDPTHLGADSLHPGMQVTLRAPDGRLQPALVRAVRGHQGRLLVSFDGVADATAAAALARADVLLARDDAVLAAGEYLDADLVGCTLLDAGGRTYGDVVDVVHYPGSDMLIVGPRRAMLPLVAAFVRQVDVAARTIVVADLPDGLLD